MKRKNNTEKFISKAKADKASNLKNEKLKRLVVDLPESLHKALKMMSIKEDKTMREIIAELIEEKQSRTENL
jgi:hypothetical protein